MNSNFCLYLNFLKELVTSISNYEHYGIDESYYALSILNKVVKENKGLFSLYPESLKNYKKIVHLLSKNTNIEVLRANTYILELENNPFSKEEYIEYFSKLHELNNIDIKEMIIFDNDILPYIIYHDTFYDAKYDNPILLKGALNYFLKMNPENKAIYDSFKRYYYNKNLNKKKSTLKMSEILYIKSKLIEGQLEDISLLYEAKEFLYKLNTYIDDNIGLLCISKDILNNYQKIFELFSSSKKELRNEYSKSYSITMFIQSLSDEEKNNLVKTYKQNNNVLIFIKNNA